MAEVTDGDVLSDVLLKITATSGKDQTPFDCRGPYGLIDKALNMLKDRIPIVASRADGSVRLCSQKESVRAVDPGESQLAHRLRYRTVITLPIRRERQGRVAYPSKTARSSAKAILRAASFSGDQSESIAPRSTSSIAWRVSSNGTRISTSAFVSRCAA